MRIGIIIGRIGDVDGVALETEKWIDVLKKMGHEIFLLSGRFKKSIIGEDRETLLKSLSFFSPKCEWEQNRAFFFPQDDPGELISHLEETSNGIAMKIFNWILVNKIEVILSENASALPCHLSMGMAIKKVVETTGMPIVTHDHDFHWERGDRYKTPFAEVQEMIDGTFPLQIPHVRHAVINTYSKDVLMKRFGIDSTVVPNVMDFSQPYGVKDDFNQGILGDLGLESSDIALFQITRIVRRKGIETAIDLVKKLDDKKVKLVITGSAADDERKGYYKELVDHIKDQNLQSQISFAYKKVLSNRHTSYSKKKIYSLEDAYAHATACTYFSTYEGFGNAFVESVLAKKPIFVNNYRPVYWPDIGSKGFKAVMLEDNILADNQVQEMKDILYDKKLQVDIAEHNFELGKKHFSYEVLAEKFSTLFHF